VLSLLQTLEESTVDIAVIHLEGDAIQWYDWFEYTHSVPIWSSPRVIGSLLRVRRVLAKGDQELAENAPRVLQKMNETCQEFIGS
ncbi:hypothetical protein GW17_00051065, partial [Ensete ventricosum]